MPDRTAGRREFDADERAVTINDAVATGTLVALTVMLGVGLGAAVLVGDDFGESGPPDANFSFSYLGANQQLVVTHEQGESIPAGELVIAVEKGDENSPLSEEETMSWAEADEVENDTSVGVGDTVSLSEGTNFGTPIANDDAVEVRWTDGNQTVVLETWND